MADGYGLSPSNVFYEATDTPPSEAAPKAGGAGGGRGNVGQRNIQVNY